MSLTMCMYSDGTYGIPIKSFFHWSNFHYLKRTGENGDIFPAAGEGNLTVQYRPQHLHVGVAKKLATFILLL